MSNVVWIHEWKREQHLKTPLGQLLVEYTQGIKDRFTHKCTNPIKCKQWPCWWAQNDPTTCLQCPERDG